MPDKIEEIATIISEIKKDTRHGKVKFVVGDGFYSQRGIRSRKIIIEDAKSQDKIISNPKEEDRICWQAYESYRWNTANVLPPLRYFYMHHLCTTGNVSAIVTTNYDLYFDSIFTKVPLPHGFSLNPLINDEEYSWEGFYSKTSEASKALKLWKIHGSFSHISFIESRQKQNHIFKLPRFSIGYPADNPIDNYGLPSHDFLDSNTSSCDCDRIAHFIDMNFPRSCFCKVIEGATIDLLSDDTALVIAVGFTGKYEPSNPSDDKNEEIVPTLIKLSKSIPVYTILAPFQNPDDSFLYNELNPGRTSMKGDIENIFRNILIHYYDQTTSEGYKKLRSLDTDYQLEWVSSNLFKIKAYE